MAVLSPYPVMQFLDDNGDPLVGGKLESFIAGTSTKKVTYTTQAGDVANANPVILDSGGRNEGGTGAIWLGEGEYKLVLSDSDDNVIWTVDDVSGAGSTNNVETIAALKAEPAGSTDRLYVGGYYADGDGGGGWFYWDASETEDDDGYYIEPGSEPATGRWIRILDGYIDLKYFGAKGDTSTDDASAIDAANTRSVALGIGLRASAGTYHIGSSIGVTANIGFGPGAILSPGNTFTLTLTGSMVGDPLTQIFAGAGTVDISGFGVPHVRPEWWGAFNGGIEAGAKFQAAVTAGAGKVILLRAGTYKTDTPINFPTNTSLIGAGAGQTTIDISDIGSGGAAYALTWGDSLTLGSDIPLASSITQPTNNATFTDSSSISNDDLLLIQDTTAASWNPFSSEYQKGEFLLVNNENVGPNQVEFTHSVFDTYSIPNANLTVKKVNTTTQKISGFTTTECLSIPNGVIVIKYGRDCVLEDLKLDSADDVGIALEWSYRCKLSNVDVANWSSAVNSWPIDIICCQELSLVNSTFSGNVWTAIGFGSDTNGICNRDVEITGCTASTTGGVAAINHHGNSEFCTITGCKVNGGINLSGRHCTVVGNIIHNGVDGAAVSLVQHRTMDFQISDNTIICEADSFVLDEAAVAMDLATYATTVGGVCVAENNKIIWNNTAASEGAVAISCRSVNGYTPGTEKTVFVIRGNTIDCSNEESLKYGIHINPYELDDDFIAIVENNVLNHCRIKVEDDCEFATIKGNTVIDNAAAFGAIQCDTYNKLIEGNVTYGNINDYAGSQDFGPFIESGVYDFAEQGGAQGNFKLKPLLPENAVITEAWYEVVDAFTSGGSATVSIGVTVDDAGGIVPVSAFDNDKYSAGYHRGIPDGRIVNFTTKTTAQRTIDLIVAGADLTAGKVVVWWKYMVTSSGGGIGTVGIANETVDGNLTVNEFTLPQDNISFGVRGDLGTQYIGKLVESTFGITNAFGIGFVSEHASGYGRIEFYTTDASGHGKRMEIGSDGDVDVTNNLIASGSLTGGNVVLSVVGPTDDLDVSGANTVLVDTSANHVTLGGLVGGVAGQVLHIVRTNNTNNFLLENIEGAGNQDIYLSSGGDEQIDSPNYGGWTLVCDGLNWFDASL